MKRWDRFGLLEIMLLVAAVAFGLSMIRDDLDWNPVAGLIATSLIASSMFGPLVIVSQFVRGRRERLIAVEWVWVVPLGIYVGYQAAGWIGLAPVTALIALPVLGILYFLLSVLAWIDFLGSTLEVGIKPLLWTQVCALLHSILFGPLLLLFFVLVFGNAFP